MKTPVENTFELTLTQENRHRFRGDCSGAWLVMEIFEHFCTVTASTRAGLDVRVEVAVPDRAGESVVEAQSA